MSEPQQNQVDTYFSEIDREVNFARILNFPVITMWWLFAANVLIYVAMYFSVAFIDEAFVGTYFSLDQIPAFTGMKVNALIDQGAYWRIISSMFVHLSVMHIGFNAYGIFVVTPMLEKFYGARRTFIVYMVAGIAGAVGSYLFNDLPSGGASGALYGLIGAMGAFGFKFRRELPRQIANRFTTGALPWIVFGIGIGFFEAIPFDNAAHIGGLLGGALAAAVMRSRLVEPRFKVGEWVVNLLTIVFIGVLVWTAAEWAAEVTECMPSRDQFIGCYPDLADKV